MKRFSRLAMCLVTLLVGVVVGGGFDSWQFSSTVRANALDRTTVESLYRQLDGNDSALVTGGKVLAKIAALTTPSVVHIQSERVNGRRGKVEETGSGVIVSNSKTDGNYVVTNRHVVDGTALKAISIHLHDGRVIHPERVWTDAATDVAVMKVTERELQPARWGDSDKTEIGHLVLAMGSPFGLSQSVTLGIISAKGRRSLRLGGRSDVINQDFLQTDAAINPGNSGGPLIDMQGQIVGINTAIASSSGGNEGIGFSIPSNLVRRVVDQLLLHGKVQRAYLGVKLDPDFDADTATRLKLDKVRGARVVEVYPNTPASRANVKFDDVIVSFDGINVQDENHLINLVSLTPVGKQVRLIVYRDSKRITMNVVLEDRIDLEQRSEAPPIPQPDVDVEQLGLSLHRLEADIARQLGYTETATGLLVLDISDGGSDHTDFHIYDLIEEVAGMPVASMDELKQVLRQHASSTSILLKVRRPDQNGGSRSRLIVRRRPSNSGYVDARHGATSLRCTSNLLP